MHDAIVVGQVAVAVLLVTGAMLLIRSLGELQSRDPGFDPRARRLLLLTLMASDKTPEVAMRAFLNETVQRAGSLPGIRAVGLTSRLPLRDLGYQGPVNRRRSSRSSRVRTATQCSCIARRVPAYSTPRVSHLLEGRWIDSTDVATSLPVTVINEESFCQAHVAP